MRFVHTRYGERSIPGVPVCLVVADLGVHASHLGDLYVRGSTRSGVRVRALDILSQSKVNHNMLITALRPRSDAVCLPGS